MTSDLHAKLQTFLQENTPVSLPGGAQPGPDLGYKKAGVVPFYRLTPRRYLMMKPVPKHAHLSPPALQICKGTRMQQLGGHWRDIRDADTPTGPCETLAVTALREGLEELGLEPSCIINLIDMGPYSFSSAISDDKKQMWLFAAQLDPDRTLLPVSQIAATTASREWMTIEEFEQHGRSDHRAILRDIDARLTAHGA